LIYRINLLPQPTRKTFEMRERKTGGWGENTLENSVHPGKFYGMGQKNLKPKGFPASCFLPGQVGKQFSTVADNLSATRACSTSKGWVSIK
jgi:hypothetical protein